MRSIIAMTCALPLFWAVTTASAGEDAWLDELLKLRSVKSETKAPKTGSVTSPVIKGGAKAGRIEMAVKGLNRIWLVAEGVPNYNHARSAWCEAELVKADGSVVKLSSLKPASAKVGWGKLVLNKDHANQPIKVKDRTFAHGVWAHANSQLSYHLDKKYVTFRSWIGLTGGPGGAVRFTVSAKPVDKNGAQDAVGKWARKYPEREKLGRELMSAWHGSPDVTGTRTYVTRQIKGSQHLAKFGTKAKHLESAQAPEKAWLKLADEIARAKRGKTQQATTVMLVDPAALRRAIDDLEATFPDTYPGEKFIARFKALNPDMAAVQAGMAKGDEACIEAAAAWVQLQRDALLANPLIDFKKLLLVRRSAKAKRLGLPQNWQSNCVLPRTGYGNDIAVLSPVSPDGKLTTLYRPDNDTFVGDVDLHFDADRILFSMSNPKAPWQVYEIKVDGSGFRQLTPDMGNDVNNYDACYLPDGDLLFTSTATMVAVPCVNGSTAVANIFRMSPDGKDVRQLCFDQEHNWCPTVLNSGRIIYQRWEYTDLPHSNSRYLFHMNPDGTAQMEYYGSNSYWPNSVFYARPIPGHPTQVIGIVGGHHGVARQGEMVLFDPAKGRFEATGAIHRFPGYGKKVERVVADRLVDRSWPKFLHPFPLGNEDGRGSGKYFLVSAQPTPKSQWGLYLIDVFDNMLLLKEQPNYVLFEPLPLRKTPKPPVVPQRVDLDRKDSLVYLADIYSGPGLKGIPKGEVKSLRVFTYVYGYRGLGGLYGTIGMDGPWDVRRVMGEVPIENDGSAFFRIPANTPVSIQPLDREGKALQIVRSWFTGMPGETISCVGCHEPQNSAPPVRRTIASEKEPTDLDAWYGKTRGFSFPREVQPVLDAQCIRCHNGTTKYGGKVLMSLRGDQPMKKWASKMPGHQNGHLGGKFSVGYANLHRYVRHPGIESSMHMLTPMDFHADTTELVQRLRKGHRGVKLTKEEWDRIVTWIDLNTPFHGDWRTIAGKKAEGLEKRRAELRKAYANVDEYHIEEPVPASKPLKPVAKIDPPKATASTIPVARKTNTGPRKTKTVDLGNGVKMTFVFIEPGEFMMGSQTGHEDERAVSKVKIAKGFWMATTETTNAQYNCFDPKHNSRREHKQGYQFGVEGYPLFKPKQPVVRISWYQAMNFAEWLGEKTGAKVTLPTEAQWEYACRVGANTPFSYGGLNSDFSKHANMADLKTKEFASNPYTLDKPIKNPPEFDDWLPKDTRFNDGALVSSDVGRYAANPWGLHDMHGNVAEWTRSTYKPYPYVDGDGRNDPGAKGDRVVRGGSWRDRPYRCTSSYRVMYRPYQPVYNVGFRVILFDE